MGVHDVRRGAPGFAPQDISSSAGQGSAARAAVWPAAALLTPAASEAALEAAITADRMQLLLQAEATALAERLQALQQKVGPDETGYDVKVKAVDNLGSEVSSYAQSLDMPTQGDSAIFVDRLADAGLPHLMQAKIRATTEELDNTTLERLVALEQVQAVSQDLSNVVTQVQAVEELGAEVTSYARTLELRVQALEAEKARLQAERAIEADEDATLKLAIGQAEQRCSEAVRKAESLEAALTESQALQEQSQRLQEANAQTLATLQQTKQELEAKAKALEEKAGVAEALQRDRDEALAKASSLEESLKQSELLHEANAEKLNALEQVKQDVQSQVAALETKVGALETIQVDRDQALAKAAALEEALKQSELTLQADAERLHAIEQFRSELEDKARMLEQKLGATETVTLERNQALQKAASLEDALKQAQLLNEASAEKLAILEQIKDEVKSKVRVLEGNVGALETLKLDRDEALAKVSALETQVGTLEVVELDRDKAMAKVQALEAQIGDLEAVQLERDQALSKVQALELHLGAMEAAQFARDQALAQVEALEAQVGALKAAQADRDQALGKVLALEAQVGALQATEVERDLALGKVSELEREVGALEADRREALGKVQALEERVGAQLAMESDQSAALDQAAQLARLGEMARQSLQQECDGALAKVALLEQELAREAQQLEAQLGAMQPLQQQRDEAVAKAEQLEAQLRDVTSLQEERDEALAQAASYKEAMRQMEFTLQAICAEPAPAAPLPREEPVEAVGASLAAPSTAEVSARHEGLPPALQAKIKAAAARLDRDAMSALTQPLRPMPQPRQVEEPPVELQSLLDRLSMARELHEQVEAQAANLEEQMGRVEGPLRISEEAKSASVSASAELQPLLQKAAEAAQLHDRLQSEVASLEEHVERSASKPQPIAATEEARLEVEMLLDKFQVAGELHNRVEAQAATLEQQLERAASKPRISEEAYVERLSEAEKLKQELESKVESLEAELRAVRSLQVKDAEERAEAEQNPLAECLASDAGIGLPDLLQAKIRATTEELDAIALHRPFTEPANEEVPQDPGAADCLAENARLGLPASVQARIRASTAELDNAAISRLAMQEQQQEQQEEKAEPQKPTDEAEPLPPPPPAPAVVAAAGSLPGHLKAKIKAITSYLDVAAMTSLPRATEEVVQQEPQCAPPVPVLAPQIEAQAPLQPQVDIEALKAQVAGAQQYARDVEESLSSENRWLKDENLRLTAQIQDNAMRLRDMEKSVLQAKLEPAVEDVQRLKELIEARDAFKNLARKSEEQIAALKRQYEQDLSRMRLEALDQRKLLDEELFHREDADRRTAAAEKAEKAAQLRIQLLQRERDELQDKVQLAGAAGRKMSEAVQQASIEKEELRKAMATANEEQRRSLQAREAELVSSLAERDKLLAKLQDTEAAVRREMDARDTQTKHEVTLREQLAKQCDTLVRRLQEQEQELAQLRAEARVRTPSPRQPPQQRNSEDNSQKLLAENMVLRKELAASWAEVSKLARRPREAELESLRRQLDEATRLREELPPPSRISEPVAVPSEIIALSSWEEESPTPAPTLAPPRTALSLQQSSSASTLLRPEASVGSSSVPVRLASSSTAAGPCFEPRVVTPTMSIAAPPATSQAPMPVGRSVPAGQLQPSIISSPANVSALSSTLSSTQAPTTLVKSASASGISSTLTNVTPRGAVLPFPAVGSTQASPQPQMAFGAVQAAVPLGACPCPPHPQTPIAEPIVTESQAPCMPKRHVPVVAAAAPVRR